MDDVVIGRERELAEANGFLEEATSRSCALLLAGAPGIGKTTIWAALSQEAVDRAYELIIARPSEAESDLAWAALVDLLAETDEAVFGSLPTPQRDAIEWALRRRSNGTTIDPAAVGLAVLGALRALGSRSRLLIAIDDIQWMDAPSLRALTFAFRRLRDTRVGLVATMRTGFEAELTHMAARPMNAVRRIDIDGLGERALAQLVLERTGRRLTPSELGRLTRLSEGNPYYALELATAEASGFGMPESLVATLRTRLSGLSGAAREVSLEAATLGRFDTAETGPVVDELRVAGVVDVHSGVPRFAHPLLASTLLEMHTAEERRLVHLRLSDGLRDPDERAIHLGRGWSGTSEDVATELESAARRLDARGAPETAAPLAERAAELTPEGSTDARTRRLLLASDLYQGAGEAGAHVLRLLEPLEESLTDGPDRARVLVRLGWLGAMSDTITTSTAIDYQERALAEAGDAPDVITAANAVLARLLGNGGDYRAAHRHAELAVAAGDLTEVNLMFPSPSGELGTARFFRGLGFDEGLFDRGIELESRLARVGEPYQSARLQRALALLYTGQTSRARAALDELLELSRELGRIRSTAGFVLHLIELEVRAGRLSEAEAYAIEFVHLDRQLRGDLSGEWYPSGLVALHLGRVEDARRILTSGIEYSRGIESTNWMAHQLRALGQLELALGNLDAAREALAPLPEMLRGMGLGEWSVHPMHPDLVQTLVELGEIDAAEELTWELDEYGRRLDRPWGIATAARSAALVSYARGRTGEALDHTERALVEHQRLEWPFEHARTLLVRGAMLRRLGSRRAAAAALSEARAIFAALRAPLWYAKVEEEERSLGGRRSTDGSLTPAEARVAELAGSGLRNAEIAARLYVAPKTVEATLSRVYRKLGVRSRTELAGRLSGNAPSGPQQP